MRFLPLSRIDRGLGGPRLVYRCEATLAQKNAGSMSQDWVQILDPLNEAMRLSGATPD
jgi:hypothetical protein